ncbi:hypothetical protein G5B30_04345 [Sphingobacterium sp. SGG-5]|uniref:hypothetical protein n=1 Tax=Sphingobacterium sp. SGG-5 TaxID=2710881 RepID=UPI0013EBF20F|nr:hypothetical protein [Sphingobacterium sp. SGG-5]NGM61145.1 hypothetical protein [Sphingobacterium sp. SGG-5]
MPVDGIRSDHQYGQNLDSLIAVHTEKGKVNIEHIAPSVKISSMATRIKPLQSG